MSRVARCIDNGPMEGFWGVMKREMYYTNNDKNFVNVLYVKKINSNKCILAYVPYKYI